MRKFLIVFIFLFIVIPLLSFEIPFLNINEMISLTPYSHFSSIEGFRNNNSFYLYFNDISLTNPITGDIFLTPSLFLSDKLNSKEGCYNIFNIKTERKSNNNTGFFRDGFSLKSERETNIINSLYFNYSKEKLNSMFIISNYGNTYTHFKDSFIGPGIEGFLNWKSGNIIFNLYMNFKKK